MAKAIGNIIQELRMQQKLKQQDLAKALNVTPMTICSYEKGTRQPSLEMVSAMADYFGVSTDVLLGRKPIPRTTQSHLDLTGQVFMKRLEDLYREYHPDHVTNQTNPTNHKK